MRRIFIPLLSLLLLPLGTWAQQEAAPNFGRPEIGVVFLLVFTICCLLVAAVFLSYKIKEIRSILKQQKEKGWMQQFLNNFDSKQIEQLLHYKKQQKTNRFNANTIIAFILFLSYNFLSLTANAQGLTDPNTEGSLWSEAGVLITITLLLVPIVAAIILMIIKSLRLVKQFKNKKNAADAHELANYLKNLPEEDFEENLRQRKKALDYTLTHNELSGTLAAEDSKGIININDNKNLPVVAQKKKAIKRPAIEPQLAKLVLWYIAAASFWLIFGTSVGWYLGVKFVAPDADHLSWLSFGRLRPVHTNAVFWGWASLGMLGLGYYIVPRVSRRPIMSYKAAWWSFWLINASVIIGSLCLMAGINNGGGEFREYIWPVMALFGAALGITLVNYIRTVANRKTKEIYISNWYMIAAIIFTIIISLAAYIPIWQDGLGETIIQGYYMHQGVGMWFMLFTLGIVYYFLPQQLNKPIYSYSLGILAFWTQILFYTLIGTHHFVFSSIPWWLQTIAIVGSAGMIIPVIAGTANFALTFKGATYKIADSYTLPFFVVGIIFYCTGSLQGTAEAFRTTNLYWHFTDFTVAHSHLTMYGIISFFLWAGIYAVIPRLTGKEPPQITVGAHFWLALIGLMFYSVPLMYGGTLKGIMWMEGKPFIESVIMMAPYWLWRAIGGTLMWLSHIFFVYNIYKMYADSGVIDVKDTALQELQSELVTE